MKGYVIPTLPGSQILLKVSRLRDFTVEVDTPAIGARLFSAVQSFRLALRLMIAPFVDGTPSSDGCDRYFEVSCWNVEETDCGKLNRDIRLAYQT